MSNHITFNKIFVLGREKRGASEWEGVAPWRSLKTASGHWTNA